MKGLAQAIIEQISAVTDPNTPQFKVTPPGLLQLLLNNPAPLSITNLAGIRAGQDRLIKLRYMKRGVESEISDTPGCDPGNGAVYEETTVTHPLYRKMSLYIELDEMRQYFDDAVNPVSMGGTSIVSELYNRIVVKLNGLLGAIDIALLQQMATRWGVNAATGVATPTAINFNTVNDVNLTDGIVKIIEHAQRNEMEGTLLMVGNGVANTYDIAQRMKIAADSNGYNSARWTGFRWYNDSYSRAAWGENNFGVISPGSASFVDWLAYEKAPYAGSRANSYFFTLPVPFFLNNGELRNLVFDVQIKEIDCPTEIDGVTRQGGYIIYISKSFGLFTTPTDAYQNDDLLAGTNGLLHYVGAIG